jgi:hypothetical protein
MTEPMKNKITPNGVLFKTDDEKPAVCLIKNEMFDWDNVLVFDPEELNVDLSSNPFEFVFVNYESGSLKTTDKKTTVPNYTFSKLYDENKLQNTIEHDYKKQYNIV